MRAQRRRWRRGGGLWRGNADDQAPPIIAWLDASIALLIDRDDPIPYEYGLPAVVALIRNKAARRLRAAAALRQGDKGL